jgi:hypothetical protein
MAMARAVSVSSLVVEVRKQQQEFPEETCSTSAGSSTPRVAVSNPHQLGSGGESGRSKFSLANSELLDYELSVPIVVRNTFIDTVRDSPIDESCNMRRSISCPVTLLSGSEIAERSVDADTTKPRRLDRCFTMGSTAVESRTQIQIPTLLGAFLHTDMGKIQKLDQHVNVGAELAQSSSSNQIFKRIPPPPQGPPGELPNSTQQKNGLSETTSLRVSGTPLTREELPSVGSIGHRTGACKPCSFFHKTARCKTGMQCPFCHLCGPDETKRRSKDKVDRLAGAYSHFGKSKKSALRNAKQYEESMRALAVMPAPGQWNAINAYFPHGHS